MTIVLVEGLRDKTLKSLVGKVRNITSRSKRHFCSGTKLQRSEMLGISTSRLAQEKRVCGRVYDAGSSQASWTQSNWVQSGIPPPGESIIGAGCLNRTDYQCFRFAELVAQLFEVS